MVLSSNPGPTQPVNDTTDQSGSGNAAEVEAGHRDKVDLEYNFDAADDDLYIEDSDDDGANWSFLKTVASGDFPSDNQGRVQLDSVKDDVRAYVGPSMADGDVNEIKVTAKKGGD